MFLFLILLFIVIPIFCFAGEVSDAWSKKGHYIAIHKFKETKRGKPFTRFEFEINLPCFYTAPGNSPCDRGSMRKNGRGISIPIRSPEQVKVFGLGGRNEYRGKRLQGTVGD